MGDVAGMLQFRPDRGEWTLENRAGRMDPGGMQQWNKVLPVHSRASPTPYGSSSLMR